MNKKIFQLLFIIAFFILFVSLKSLLALTCNIKFKNRIFPIQVVDLKFLYYGNAIAAPYLIVSLKEQRHKYIKFHVSELRKIVFKKVVGEKGLYPSYLIQIYLKKGGHYIPAYILPVKKIEAIKNGQKWNLNLKLKSIYEKNVYNLQEIIFLNRRF